MWPGVATTRTSSPPVVSTSPSPRSSWPRPTARTRVPVSSAKRGAAVGVVVVAVGEHRLGHPGAALLHDPKHGGEVALVERTGVDDHGLRRAGLEQHPGVGAVEGHRPGVGCQHAVRTRRDVAARPRGGHRRRRGGGHPPEYAVAACSCAARRRPRRPSRAGTPTITDSRARRRATARTRLRRRRDGADRAHPRVVPAFVRPWAHPGLWMTASAVATHRATMSG